MLINGDFRGSQTFISLALGNLKMFYRQIGTQADDL